MKQRIQTLTFLLLGIVIAGSACTVKPITTQSESSKFATSTTSSTSTDAMGCLQNPLSRRDVAQKKYREIQDSISARLRALKETSESSGNNNSFAAIGTMGAIMADSANQYSNFPCWPESAKSQLNSLIAALKKASFDAILYSQSSNSSQSTISQLKDQLTTDVSDTTATSSSFLSAISR